MPKIFTCSTTLPSMTKAAMSPSMPLTASYPPSPSPPNTSNRVVAFTTPGNYASRLSHLIQLKGWTPLWSPTISVQPTPQTKSSLQHYLLPHPNPNQNQNQNQSPLEDFSAIAFTSRTGILGFSEVLNEIKTPPLAPTGNEFTISALGKDSELLNVSFIERICSNFARINVLVPQVVTPSGMVESLGIGRGRRILCPVPLVMGLEEPPVVPNFIRDLGLKGWVAVRVDGYETRWMGPRCAEAVAGRSEVGGGLDAVVFTSTGEVEGLLKSLMELGLDWETVKKRLPRLVVAAHGPVTAAGAERLGVGVDVVSCRYGSFDGVVDALALLWQ